MLKTKSLNIIVDTNLWISFIISNNLKTLDPFLLSGKVRLLFSLELIDEIQKTITKPKLAKYFRNNALELMLASFEPFTDLVEVTSTVSMCRDFKDNFLLALSKDGNADFLITGDKDLLELQKFGKTKITTIQSFVTVTKI